MLSLECNILPADWNN